MLRNPLWAECAYICGQKNGVMGILNYKIKASELDERFLEALKSLFKDAEIAISVEQISEPAEKGSKQSIWDIIEHNNKANHAYQFSAAEFSSIVEESVSNENYDLEAAFEQHKILKNNAKTAN